MGGRVAKLLVVVRGVEERGEHWRGAEWRAPVVEAARGREGLEERLSLHVHGRRRRPGSGIQECAMSLLECATVCNDILESTI